MSGAENNVNYYVVEFAAGAASTFTTAIQLNRPYDRVFVRRQTMASICTIYPQVAATNASGSYFRVLLPQDQDVGEIESSVSNVLTLGTNVSGYWIAMNHVGNMPYLRFEVASLPTLAVQMHVYTSQGDR